MMGFASSMGMAKPMPSYCDEEIFAVFMPMTSPLWLTRAPPELPGFMAASVWMRLSVLLSMVTDLFSPLIMPCVVVPANSWPRGLPMAMAVSPSAMVRGYDSRCAGGSADDVFLLCGILGFAEWYSSFHHRFGCLYFRFIDRDFQNSHKPCRKRTIRGRTYVRIHYYTNLSIDCIASGR